MVFSLKSSQKWCFYLTYTKLLLPLPAVAGKGTATDTKKGICTRTRDTRIRVPGGFPVPVSITTHQGHHHHHHHITPLQQRQQDGPGLTNG